MKRKILAGYEAEHRGADVLALTHLLAELLDANPVVLTAKPWPKSVDVALPTDAQLERSLRKQFEAVHSELDPLGVETRAVVSPSPARAINEFAESDSAVRTIVLGSAHRGAIGRTLLGSVGESLMHGAPCAIAIAPDNYAEIGSGKMQSIAVAFDGSDESRSALDAAIALASRCHATLTVVAVADYLSFGYATTWASLRPARSQMPTIARSRCCWTRPTG